MKKDNNTVKLLLIQPENPRIRRFRRGQLNNFAQLSMPYLAAFADPARFEITIADERADRIPYKKAFDLVCITVNTPNAPHAYTIAAAFHRGGAKVAMGGPHATLCGEEAALHCDYLLQGESEESWPAFLEDFYNGVPKPLYTCRRPPSLECLPLPRWDLLKRRKLMKGAVFATRGCPYQCSFCNLKQIYHDSFRTRPIAQVVAEIAQMPTRTFVFWDDNLFADSTYAKALMRAIAPLKRKWAAQTAIRDCDDEELLQLAGDAGCQVLFVGLESFAQTSLIHAGKENVHRLNDTKRLIDALHAHDIAVQAGIVFGFDAEGSEIFTQTLNACESLGVDGATVSLLTPYPGTPLYAQFCAQNRLLTRDWRYYDAKTCVVFAPDKMSPEELYDGYVAFRRRFYSLRSFIRRMRVSKTRVFMNFLLNLGYAVAARLPGG